VDPGDTMDFDAGILKMHTFKKLPMQRPNINAIVSETQYSCGSDGFNIIQRDLSKSR
jgi:hypothetical protein